MLEQLLRSPNKSRWAEDFYQLHWSRFVREDPTVRKTDTFMNRSGAAWDFDFIERSIRPRSSLFPVNALMNIEIVLDDMRFVRYMDPTNEFSFMQLIPQYMRQRHPELARAFRKAQEAYVNSDDPSNFRGSPLFNLLWQGRALRDRIQQRNKLFDRLKSHKRDTIDVSDIARAQYDSLHGAVAYAQTVNQPKYTLTRVNDELFEGSLQRGVFDGLDDPSIVSLFSGTSFIERGYAESIIQRRGFKPWHPRYFIDAAPMALQLLTMLDPHGEGNKYLPLQLTGDTMRDFADWMSEESRLILKTNGTTCQSVESAYEETSRFLQHVDSQTVVLWETVPTVYCATDERVYGSSIDDFPRDFLYEFLLVPPEKERAFRPLVERVDSGRSFYYAIGFAVREPVELHDQYCRRRVQLDEGTKLILHKSHRYSEADIRELARSFGMGIIGDLHGEGVALYKAA